MAEIYVWKDVLSDDENIVLDFDGNVLTGTKKLAVKFTASKTSGDLIQDSLTSETVITETLKGF